MNNYLSIL